MRGTMPNPSLRTLATATLLAVPLSFVGAAVNGADASAVTRFSNDVGPLEVNTVCSFPIMVSGHADGLAIETASQSTIHVTEQDTFSANGHTWVGLPYTANIHNARNQGTGVIERIPLDNGTTFLAAGRVDFNLDQGDFVMTPTFGTSPDIAEFCAE